MTKIAFLASAAPPAQEALARLVALYGDVPPNEAEFIVALGGDGLMLETQHRFLGRNAPIYGMNRGSVGFLMNSGARRICPRGCRRPGRASASRCACAPLGDRHPCLARHQRGLAAAGAAPGRQAAHPGGWQGAPGGTDLRRHPDLHPRRQHRL
jgi:hypothetical protein